MPDPRAFHILIDLLRVRQPLVVFLSETKCGEEITERIKRSCGFQGCLTVRSAGAKGGLCLLWKREVNVRVISYSLNHIDSEIRWENKNWRFTGIYGFLEGNKKVLTWNLLRTLYNGDDSPWLVGGDFNEILCESEKSGSISRDRGSIGKLKEALDDCNLKDIDFKGSTFT